MRNKEVIWYFELRRVKKSRKRRRRKEGCVVLWHIIIGLCFDRGVCDDGIFELR